MLGAAIYGYGRMGHEIENVINGTEGIRVASVIDISGEISNGAPDIVIEFATADSHDGALAYALERGIPLVCGTTGLSDDQMNAMKAASAKIPVLYSSNYSYGIYTMRKLLKLACSLLSEEDWDAEVVEAHHKKKLDAPSGTAKTLIEDMGGNDRISGVHALRGGTEAGRHAVTFFGDNEQITIEHHAQSRRIFATGAVKAALNMKTAPGFYSLDDILQPAD